MKRGTSCSEDMLKRAEDRGQRMRSEKKHQMIKEMRRMHTASAESEFATARDLPIYCSQIRQNSIPMITHGVH